MLAEHSGTRDLIAFVVRHVSCSVCNHAYAADDVAIVRHSAESWVLAATCPSCHTERLITAFDRPPYALLPHMGMGILPPITQAEVDEWARFLAHFRGDLKALLAAI